MTASFMFLATPLRVTRGLPAEAHGLGLGQLVGYLDAWYVQVTVVSRTREMSAMGVTVAP